MKIIIRDVLIGLGDGTHWRLKDTHKLDVSSEELSLCIMTQIYNKEWWNKFRGGKRR